MASEEKRQSYKGISEANDRALFVQANADIDEAARYATRYILGGSFGRSLPYPPNASLTTEEQAALHALKAIPHLESSLQKVIADAASLPLFRLFEYIDGVADPDDPDWTGVYLIDYPRENSDDEDADFESIAVEGTRYHDQLYARYQDWRAKQEAKPPSSV